MMGLHIFMGPYVLMVATCIYDGPHVLMVGPHVLIVEPHVLMVEPHVLMVDHMY